MIGDDRQAEILRLYHAEKWRVGTIATQLGMHHSTVERVLGQAGVRMVTSRPSMLDPYLPMIVETLTKYPRLRASRLFQMARERGYRGSADHLATWSPVYGHAPRRKPSCGCTHFPASRPA